MNKLTQQSVLCCGHEFPWEKDSIQRWRTMLSCLPKSSRRVLLDRQLKNPNHHYTLRREQGSKSALKSTNCNKCSHNLNNYLVTYSESEIAHIEQGDERRKRKEWVAYFCGRSFRSLPLRLTFKKQKTVLILPQPHCSVAFPASLTLPQRFAKTRAATKT
jgi:hypothetical protein